MSALPRTPAQALFLMDDLMIVSARSHPLRVAAARQRLSQNAEPGERASSRAIVEQKSPKDGSSGETAVQPR